MNSTIKYIFYFSIICFLISGCEEEQVTQRPYPRLNTLPVTEISDEGAKFNAEIIYRGDFEVINYGFVWAKAQNPTKELSDGVIYADNIQSSNFSAIINTTLEENVAYSVRAFIETNDYIVYGENKEFLSLGSGAPIITSIKPSTAIHGDTILIKGDGFSFVKTSNIVKIGDHKTNVIESSDTLLSVVVPYKPLDMVSDVSVSIVGNIAYSSQKLQLEEIKISEINPTSARSYDTISISGIFKYFPEFSDIMIGSKSCEIISLENDFMKVIVPPGITTDTVKLSVGKQIVTITDFKYLKPAISFMPTNGTWLDELTITGENFQTRENGNEILINFQTSYNGNPYVHQSDKCEIINQGKDFITFIIPEEIRYKSNKIILKDGGHSLDFDFEMNTILIESITPNEATFGDEIIIKGKNFHPTNNKIGLFKGNNYSGSNIISNSSDEIRFLFPNSAFTYDGLFNIQYAPNKMGPVIVIEDSLTLKSPEISDFNPKYVENYGGQITITGKGFSPDINNNIITFGNKQMTVISASQNQIIAEINTSFDDTRKSTNIIDKITVVSGGVTTTSEIMLEFDYKSSWTELKNVPDDAFASLGTQTSVDNQIIFTGGYLFNEPNPIKVYSYNTDSKEWSVLGNLPNNQPRERPFSEGGNNAFYFGFGNYLQDMYRFDLITNTWEEIPAKFETTGSYSQSHASYFDGNLNLLDNEYIYEYDPISKNWMTSDSLPYPTKHWEGGFIIEREAFKYNNQPYFVLFDLNNQSIIEAYLRFYKKINNEWIEDGYLHSEAEWGTFKGIIEYKNQLYIADRYNLYTLDLENYTVSPVSKPYLGGREIRFVVEGKDGIYFGMSNDTLWKYDPDK
ncbi:IPT/TIG domain-containing protein [Mangrovivirga sp. M17]|uniref:IPT/TIG domain-containing protein n=1 Tax=Mangrovivirga halotolerans TaxID=2993936 RepID=A0ABT3RMY9_9BACT|nr:IPT/TIG domain-containing protein [Mangrovivirga halotolerans]MCX2743174.1 IPT/TIG domain-containing protein [Mangrovivirga halotolerans]